MLPILFSEQWGFGFDRIPPLGGRVAVVTGANTGLGYYTAMHLARNGASVVLACRSEAKCRAAADAISRNLTTAPPVPGGSATPLQLDLSSLRSVRAFAAALNREHTHIDQLVLNAGLITAEYSVSTDGIETQWATNHVGHHFLFKLLEPALERAANTTGRATVTVVSSGAHFHPTHLPLSSAEVNNAAAFDNVGRYGETKLANVLFAIEAQRRHMGRNIFVNSLHPGMVMSEFARPELFDKLAGPTLGPHLFHFFWHVFSGAAWDSETAALTQLYTACSPEIATNDVRGRYFHPIALENTPSALATPENAAKLWEFTDSLLHEKAA